MRSWGPWVTDLERRRAMAAYRERKAEWDRFKRGAAIFMWIAAPIAACVGFVMAYFAQATL